MAGLTAQPATLLAGATSLGGQSLLAGAGLAPATTTGAPAGISVCAPATGVAGAKGHSADGVAVGQAAGAPALTHPVSSGIALVAAAKYMLYVEPAGGTGRPAGIDVGMPYGLLGVAPVTFARRTLFASAAPPGSSAGSSESSTRIWAMLYSRDAPSADAGASPIRGRR